MCTVVAVALIRDLSIIVATGVISLAILVVGLLFFLLYRSIRRTTRNLEEISSITLNKVAKPLSSFSTLLEAMNHVLGWVQQYRSQERRSENEEK